MAMNNNVSYQNYGRAFIFGAKQGVAKYATVTTTQGREKGEMRLSADHEYVAGSQLTPTTFLFAAATLHNYVGALEKKPDLQKRILMVLPDDCSIRFFEMKKAFQEVLNSGENYEFDDIVDILAAAASKDWMSEDWKQSVLAFAHAYVEAVGEDVEIGVMKHTNLYRWELRPTEKGAKAPFKAGDKLNIDHAIIEGVDGWKAENNYVTGKDLEVSTRTYGNGENTNSVTRYYVPRMGNHVGLKNLKVADAALRDALPHMEEITEVSEAVAEF